MLQFLEKKIKKPIIRNYGLKFPLATNHQKPLGDL